jgi:hypothetical protein
MILDSSFDILNRAATLRLHKPFEWEVHGSDADRLIGRLPFSVSDVVRDQLIRISLLDHFNVDSLSPESYVSDGFRCRFPSGYPEVLPEPIHQDWLLPDSMVFPSVETSGCQIYLNISATDLQFVATLPLLNPIESMFDANIYIREHPEVLALGGQPLFGFHWYMATNWADTPRTADFFWISGAEDFGDWMSQTREQADKWLAQTDHPPLWRPGFEPGTWA